MEALLSTQKSHSCMDWLRLIHKNDPDEQYIVTEVSHYKRQSPWPVLQPECLTLLVRPPPNQPHPALAPVLIKVSRDVCRIFYPSRYRLCGPTDDNVSVLGPAVDVQLHDQRLHHLTWSPEEAPRLEKIACIIGCVHYHIPQRCLGLKRRCYAFVHAILQAIHIGCNGMPGTVKPLFLVPSTFLVHTLRRGSSLTDRIVEAIWIQSLIFGKEEERIEEVQQIPLWSLSCLTYVFPIGIRSVRAVTILDGDGYEISVGTHHHRAEVLYQELRS